VNGREANPRAERLLAFGLGDEDLAAWSESGLPDHAFHEWLTDRVARRPSGSRARQVYGAADVHDFARRAILDALALAPGDRLLEIGCGGGLLLREALATGARATGLDHSEEMVELASERAPGATVVLAAAESLPFAEDTFDAVAMSVVFFFLAARSWSGASAAACCAEVAASRSTRRRPSCAEPRQRPSPSQAAVTSTRTRNSRRSRAVPGWAT
jgi:SAM-dependent methyltransferase